MRKFSLPIKNLSKILLQSETHAHFMKLVCLIKPIALKYA